MWAGNPGGSSGRKGARMKLSESAKHTLVMVLGCLIPLVALGILWLAGVSQNILSFGIILLCPIMHLIMMRNVKHQNNDTRET